MKYNQTKLINTVCLIGPLLFLNLTFFMNSSLVSALQAEGFKSILSTLPVKSRTFFGRILIIINNLED